MAKKKTKEQKAARRPVADKHTQRDTNLEVKEEMIDNGERDEPVLPRTQKEKNLAMKEQNRKQREHEAEKKQSEKN